MTEQKQSRPSFFTDLPSLKSKPGIKVIKKMFCRQDRLMTDGKGIVTNGHWFVKFPDKNFLPESIDRGKQKGGVFYLHQPCSSMWIFGGIEVKTKKDVEIPDFSVILKDMNRSDLVPVEIKHPILKQPVVSPWHLGNNGHDTLFLYVKINGEDRTIGVDRDYFEDILTLAGIVFPHYNPYKDGHGGIINLGFALRDSEEDIIIMEVAKEIQAILMPVRLS